MNLTKIKKNHKNFEKQIDNVLKYGLKVLTDEEKSKNEKKLLLELLLLKSCSLWESFIESELIHLINLDQSKFREEFELISSIALSDELLRAIIFSDHYRDFNDIEKASGFFNKVIVNNCNAFSMISKDQKKYLKLTYSIRNYTVHYSAFAKKKLTMEYKNKLNISKFVEPNILLIKHNGNLFESLVHNFILTSKRMLIKFK